MKFIYGCIQMPTYKGTISLRFQIIWIEINQATGRLAVESIIFQVFGVMVMVSGHPLWRSTAHTSGQTVHMFLAFILINLMVMDPAANTGGL